MDRSGEALVRAALHDLSNTFAGIQGILDLSDPAQPLAPQARNRLEALLSDGMQLLTRTRHLALGTRPEALPESGAAWRGALEQQLQPLAAAFRCEIRLNPLGEAAFDRWPGELARGWALAVTRQVLPYLASGPSPQALNLDLEATAPSWRLTWHPVKLLPDCLKPSEEPPRDIGSAWVREVGRTLGVEAHFEGNRLTARIPRF